MEPPEHFDKLVQFLGKDGGARMQALLAQHQAEVQGAVSEGCLAVPIDVFDLMADAYELGEQLISNTGVYAAALHALMCSQQLISPSTRLWLRLSPCRVTGRTYASIRELLQGVAVCGAHNVAIGGIVTQLSTSTHLIYSRLLRCTACSFEFQHIQGALYQTCSCSQGLWEEKVQGRVLCPMRVAHICDPSSSSTGSGQACRLEVTFQDDLARHSALRVGAVVRVSGHTQAVAHTTTTGQLALGHIKVVATDISYFLPPLTLSSHKFTPPEGFREDPLHSLVLALVDATGGCIPLSPLAGLALLCSSAVAGHSMRQLQAGITAGVQPPVSADVHLPASSLMSQLTQGGVMAAATRVMRPLSVLIKHAQCDPLTPRLVRGMASLLSNHTVAPGGPVADVFQCRTGKVSFSVDAATAEGALQVTASALIEANSGIFVLDPSLAFEAPSRMKSQAMSQLAAALAAPHLIVSSAHPELVVHNCATVWATAGITAAPKGEALLTDRFSVICTNDAPDQAILAACFQDTATDAATVKFNLAQAAALKQHMARVAHLPLQTTCSPMASELLVAYCASVRAQLPMGLRQVHDSLFGLAIGCARLNLRTVVLPLDVTVAVVLMEDTLMSRYGATCLDLGPQLSWRTARGVAYTLDAQLEKAGELLSHQLGSSMVDGVEVNGPMF